MWFQGGHPSGARAVRPSTVLGGRQGNPSYWVGSGDSVWAAARYLAPPGAGVSTKKQGKGGEAALIRIHINGSPEDGGLSRVHS